MLSYMCSHRWPIGGRLTEAQNGCSVSAPTFTHIRTRKREWSVLPKDGAGFEPPTVRFLDNTLYHLSHSRCYQVEAASVLAALPPCLISRKLKLLNWMLFFPSVTSGCSLFPAISPLNEALRSSFGWSQGASVKLNWFAVSCRPRDTVHRWSIVSLF